MSFKIIEKFENEIANFYGAPYAVAVDCCTHAIELCLRYIKPKKITFPTHTYLSVVFLGEKLGIEWNWDENEWENYYYIGGTNIIDAAVLWAKDSYIPKSFMCLSFQFQKHLSLGRGGMILTDSLQAKKTLKRMTHDGREPNILWRDQNIKNIGYHYYMTPETAELGLKKINDAKNKKPRKWKMQDWPDLRNMEIFK